MQWSRHHGFTHAFTQELAQNTPPSLSPLSRSCMTLKRQAIID
jgi:hypothetical protein